MPSPITEMDRARGMIRLGSRDSSAVVRRRLEADPGPEGEEQADAYRARGQPALGGEALEGVHEVERAGGDVPAGEQEAVEDQQDEDLADQAGREQGGGDPDLEAR